MGPLTGVGLAANIISFINFAQTVVGGNGRSFLLFLQYYRLPGLVLYVFGSRGMWRIQTGVLYSTDDAHVMGFKKSVQQDSNIIAVAGTIIAQIAITALSLNNLSRTHWVARAAFTFSLVSALMSVYYATSQYRSLGRCLSPHEVRKWIMGKPLNKDHTRSPANRLEYMLPSPASVLTVSAPNMLLSASLHSFLIGLGIYFGYIWTRDLDENAGAYASRAVFITYLVGLVVCYGIFGLSSFIVAGQSYQSERDLLKYLKKSRVADQGVHQDEEPLQHDHDSKRPVSGDVESQPIGGTDIEAPEGFYAPSRGDVKKTSQQGSGLLDENDRQDLTDTLRDLVRLRKQLAEVDDRMVKVLSKLVRVGEAGRYNCISLLEDVHMHSLSRLRMPAYQ